MEENVDFTQLSNPLQLEALTSQIRHFGQCPKQLFPSSPHPMRLVRTISISNYQNPQGVQQVDSLQQDLIQSKQEIQRLLSEIEKAHKEKDEALLRQIQEFKALDDQHRRKLIRYKQESNLKFEKIKDKVFEMKQKQVEIKKEADGKLLQKENEYKQQIE